MTDAHPLPWYLRAPSPPYEAAVCAANGVAIFTASREVAEFILARVNGVEEIAEAWHRRGVDPDYPVDMDAAIEKARGG